MGYEKVVIIFLALSMLFCLATARQISKRRREKVKICKLKLSVRAGYYLIIGIMFFALAVIIMRKWEVFAFLIVTIGYVFYLLIEHQQELKKLEEKK